MIDSMAGCLSVLWDITKGSWLTGGILLLLRGIFRRRLTPKAKYALWLLLVLRLMLPVLPESELSLMNLTGDVYEQVVQEPLRVEAVDERPAVASMTSAAPMTEKETDVETEAAVVFEAPVAQRLSRTEVLFWGWLLGAALLGLCYAVLYLITRIRLSTYPSCQDEETILRFRIFKGKLGVGNRVRLAMGSGGMLGGLFCPTLVLPAEVYGTAAEPIMVHELMHHRYHDNWIYLFLRGLTVVHWFNPMVWLCFFLAKQDSECACDQRVLDSGLVTVKDYLTQLVEQGLLSHRRSILMHTSFTATRRGYLRRVGEIAGYVKKRPLRIVLPAILAAVILFLTLTGKTTPAEPQAVLTMEDASYVSMTQVDGGLYVVDYSGKIYTMDWYTGEMKLFSKGPGTGQAWISDVTLENLYYIKDGRLCHMSAATGEKTELISVPETSEILTATESCVLLLQEDGYYVLHLDTLDSEPIYTDNAIVTFITGAQDEVYVAMEYKSEKPNELQHWNLATGEKRVLFTSEKSLTMVYNGVIAEDRVYFYIDTSLYTMKLGEEPVQVGACIEGSPDVTVACSDGSVIYTNYSQGAINKRYIPEENRSVILTEANGVTAYYAAVFDGRYAIMSRYFTGSYGSRWVIADIPEEG